MSAPASPRSYVFRYSRGKTIAWLVFHVVLGGFFVFGSAMPYFFFGKTVLLWLVPIVALPFVLIFRHLWQQLRHREPILELNDKGLVDHRGPGRRVLWTSLRRVGHTTLSGSQVMSLTFIDSATADAIFGLSRLPSAFNMRLDGFLTGDRPHAAIAISDLEESPHKLVKLAQALHLRATSAARTPRPDAQR